MEIKKLSINATDKSTTNPVGNMQNDLDVKSQDRNFTEFMLNIFFATTVVFYVFPAIFVTATFLKISINLVCFMTAIVSLLVLFFDKQAQYICTMPILGLASAAYVSDTWGSAVLSGAVLFSMITWGLSVLVLSMIKKTIVFKFFSGTILATLYMGVGIILAMYAIPFLTWSDGKYWNFAYFPLEYSLYAAFFILLSVVLFMLLLPRRLLMYSPFFGITFAYIGAIALGYDVNVVGQLTAYFKNNFSSEFLNFEFLKNSIDSSFFLPAWNGKAALIMSAVAMFTALEQCAPPRVNLTYQQNYKKADGRPYVQFNMHSAVALGIGAFFCALFGGMIMRRSVEVHSLSILGRVNRRRGIVFAALLLLLFSCFPFWGTFINAMPPTIFGAGLLLIAGYIICMGMAMFPTLQKIPIYDLILSSIFLLSLLIPERFWFDVFRIHILWLLLIPMLIIQSIIKRS